MMWYAILYGSVFILSYLAAFTCLLMCLKAVFTYDKLAAGTFVSMWGFLASFFFSALLKKIDSLFKTYIIGEEPVLPQTNNLDVSSIIKCRCTNLGNFLRNSVFSKAYLLIVLFDLKSI